MPRTLKDINIEVGTRIKEKRLARKLTREDLARLRVYPGAVYGPESFCGQSAVWRRSRGIFLYRSEVERSSTAKTGAYHPNDRRGYCLHTIIKAPAPKRHRGLLRRVHFFYQFLQLFRLPEGFEIQVHQRVPERHQRFIPQRLILRHVGQKILP